jgi:hypothetical protein
MEEQSNRETTGDPGLHTGGREDEGTGIHRSGRDADNVVQGQIVFFVTEHHFNTNKGLIHIASTKERAQAWLERKVASTKTSTNKNQKLFRINPQYSIEEYFIDQENRI